MKKKAIKVGLIVYLLLFVYIMIFGNFNLDNHLTKAFILLSLPVIFFTLRK